MLFKEKVLLSNGDSVICRESDEIKKRLLMALAFSNGVILSPNILLDNNGIDDILSSRNIKDYVNNCDSPSFIIRGRNITSIGSIENYFDSCEDEYIISSLPGSPKKKDLKESQLSAFKAKLRNVDLQLKDINPTYINTDFEKDSLRKEIYSRLIENDIWEKYFKNENQYGLFIDETKEICSRSSWYDYNKKEIAKFLNDKISIDQFKMEIIDTSYNYVYTGTSDAFIQDDIKYLSVFPIELFEGAVSIKRHREKIENIKFYIDLIQFVSSLGTDQIMKVIANEALEYLEDKAVEKGFEILSRRNWFGLYPKLRNHMGVEVK